jgi:hypothetical protein
MTCIPKRSLEAVLWVTFCIVAAAALALGGQRAAGAQDCAEPFDRPETACVLVDGASAQGYLRARGARNVYRVDVPAAGVTIEADLSDLPADYDLYLTDSSGTGLASSVSEGILPERIRFPTTTEGTYFLFVVVDPERPFMASVPYRLTLTLSAPARPGPSPSPTAAPATAATPAGAATMSGARPTPTGAAGPANARCGQAPQRGFGKVWDERPDVQRALGCPRSVEQAMDGVDQAFERGWMLWRQDTREIVVLAGDALTDERGAYGEWRDYPDTYLAGESEPPAGAVPPGRSVPVRGFGRVWRERPGVREQLGFATGQESAFRGAIQEFEHGRMIWSGETTRQVWVLYGNGSYFRTRDDWAPEPSAAELEQAAARDQREAEARLAAFRTSPSAGAALRDGALIRAPNGPIYQMLGTTRDWIPTMDEFHARGHRVEQTVLVPEDAIRALPLKVLDGMLLKGSSERVYLMEDGKRRWITTMEVYAALGYDQNMLHYVTDRLLWSYPEGAILDSKP